jgi:ribonuclease Z
LDEDGQVMYAVDKYTTQPPHLSYAYISDTIYDETLVGQLNSIDVLYHETTFLQEDHSKAQETFHTTAQQAAQLAKTAKVGSLLMGHYSSRYQDLNPLLQEAQAVFPKSQLSEQGKRYRIGDAQEIVEKAGENSP